MYKGFYSYDGDIIKWSSNQQYFLKMTGWDENNPDRRLVLAEINTDKLKKMKRDKALYVINQYWNSGTRMWKFNGELYSNEVDVRKVEPHKFAHIYKQIYGKYELNPETGKYFQRKLETPIEHTYYNEYKIVWHQGHIYWGLVSQYYPRIQLAEFESLDKEPHNWVKWTSIDNCRGVVNLNTGKIV